MLAPCASFQDLDYCTERLVGGKVGVFIIVSRNHYIWFFWRKRLTCRINQCYSSLLHSIVKFFDIINFEAELDQCSLAFFLKEIKKRASFWSEQFYVVIQYTHMHIVDLFVGIIQLEVSWRFATEYPGVEINDFLVEVLNDNTYMIYFYDQFQTSSDSAK